MQVNRALKRMKRMFLRSVTDLLKSEGRQFDSPPLSILQLLRELEAKGHLTPMPDVGCFSRAVEVSPP
jgi:hypothetical protein